MSERRSAAQAVVLATTLHDPDGALVPLIDEYLPQLKRVYSSISAATSPPTHPRVNQSLARHGAYAGTPRSNLRGPLYRWCIRHALRSIPPRVHYLDLDRALHWVLRGKAGIAALSQLLQRTSEHAVTVVGRTSRAHSDHQRSLYETEKILNHVMSRGLELDGRVDFLAPSVILEASLARRLLRLSKASDSQIYGEWAALWFHLSPRVAYLESNWIDWETPDREPALLKRLGIDAYRDRFDSVGQWRLRLGLAKQILAGFETALRNLPRGTRAARLQRI